MTDPLSKILDPKELADMIEEAKREGENVERFIEERIDSIQRGAKRAPKRFRPNPKPAAPPADNPES